MTARLSGAPQEAGCALVTGASRGIGAAIALALAEDGWRCGVNFRSDAGGAAEVVERIRKNGGQALAIRADVTDPADVDAAFGELETTYGSVLCLVNNAGVRADGSAALLTAEEWTTVLRTNLDAVFSVCRRATGRMIRARWGRIVNISSVAGVRASPGQVNYAAAKAGLLGLTRTLAVELAGRGVTVNAVAPGFVETTLTEDVSRGILDLVPVGRPGTPEEVASCVRFLAAAGSGYVTGITLPVDGGLSA